MAKQEEKTLTEYILSQLENPVMVTEVDEKGKKQKVRAKDPVDGHELQHALRLCGIEKTIEL